MTCQVVFPSVLREHLCDALPCLLVCRELVFVVFGEVLSCFRRVHFLLLFNKRLERYCFSLDRFRLQDVWDHRIHRHKERSSARPYRLALADRVLRVFLSYIVIAGLQRLEYRGYDSAGVAVILEESK